ncbi:MAG: sucrose-6-phosphate hydrolase [Vagococcus sp.]
MAKKIERWTTNLRYKPYDEWPNDYIKFLSNSVNNANWRLNFHVQPDTGLLNDPNGFSYFNNKWHLFYQYYPMGPVHGIKSWYHLTSDNLVDWKKEDIALLPDTEFDSHGVYSGSAIPLNDDLFLMYTGNVRDSEWNRHAYQIGAWLNKEGDIKKEAYPLIDTPPSGYTHDFRDPQVFQYEDSFYLLIGAQTIDEKGDILIYQSKNLTNWDYLGPLDYTSNDMGYMVECPNIVFVDEKPILLFCPQGLDKSIMPYDNIYPNVYVMGDTFETDSLAFSNPSSLQLLDEGFDVYASQAFNAPDGRVLSVGWIGLPEVDYPTFDDGWAHCLSLVKEMTITNHTLYQYPVEETKELRNSHSSLTGVVNGTKDVVIVPNSNSYELELTFKENTSGTLTLYADPVAKTGLTIHYNTKSGTIIVDRCQAGKPFAEAFGTTRHVQLSPHSPLTLTIFADASVCELFINKGEKTLTSRVFPDKCHTTVFIEGEESTYFGDYYPLRTTETKK